MASHDIDEIDFEDEEVTKLEDRRRRAKGALWAIGLGLLGGAVLSTGSHIHTLKKNLARLQQSQAVDFGEAVRTHTCDQIKQHNLGEGFMIVIPAEALRIPGRKSLTEAGFAVNRWASNASDITVIRHGKGLSYFYKGNESRAPGQRPVFYDTTRVTANIDPFICQ